MIKSYMLITISVLIYLPNILLAETSKEILQSINNSIPNIEPYYQLLNVKDWNKILKKEKILLKFIKKDDFLLRYVCFSDQIPIKFLSKYTNGAKKKSATIYDIIDVNTVDSINKIVFPIYPTSVTWLIGNKSGKCKIIQYYLFGKTISTHIINLEREELNDISNFKFKSSLIYGTEVQSSDYVTLVSIFNQNQPQSFWLQGINKIISHYIANDPQDSSKGFKLCFPFNGYPDEKLNFKYDDYNKYISKIAFLYRILNHLFYFKEEDRQYLDQFYRKF